ncbi:MAG: ATP-binding protein [Elusimicrobia bacterium]|nr:ATP-binding protein [Elusimicrobiota bacterium]
MEDLSLHVLDIAENSIRALAENVVIRIIEEPGKDLLTLEIEDDGQGMDEGLLEKALDPFFTTKAGKRVGLGLPLLSQAARAGGGDMQIESGPGAGTRIRATFRYSHPDRKPLGDMPATMRALMAANPAVNFVFVHKKEGETHRVESREMGSQG